jgi:hypothetical protein
MYKARTAKNGFKGSCGHQIAVGAKFLVAEKRPEFLCSPCGVEAMHAKLKAIRDELTATAQRVAENAKAVAEGAR